MQRHAWTLVTAGVAFLGWGVWLLATPSEARAGAPPIGRALAADVKMSLRGADTGGGGTEKRCIPVGTKFGCPGRSCSGGIGSICVMCTNATTPLNGECSTLGTGPICTTVSIWDCIQADPPLTGTQGTCTAAGCIPLHPAVFVSCGVFATCP